MQWTKFIFWLLLKTSYLSSTKLTSTTLRLSLSVRKFNEKRKLFNKENEIVVTLYQMVNRYNGEVIRASTPQSVDLGSISLSSAIKDFKHNLKSA